MKSEGVWICEDCGTEVQRDYQELSCSGIPVCLECGEYMEFHHDVFFNDDDGGVTITWLPGDIATLRPNWTEERCADFLQRIEKGLLDQSIQTGWVVIEDALWDEDGGEEKDDETVYAEETERVGGGDTGLFIGIIPDTKEG